MLSKYYNQVLERNRWSSRKFIEKAISSIEKDWDNKILFVIEAPTGYGKSSIAQTISLYSFDEELKSIIVFPLRALLEDQYNKFEKIVLRPETVGKRYMHNLNSRYLIKPITLTTIDTLSLTLFGIPPEDFDKVVKYWSGTSSGSMGHYLFSHSSIVLSNIVLDEVHLLTDSTKSLNFLFLLIEYAAENGQKLVLMSATLPTVILKKLEDYKLLSIGARLKDKLKIIRFCENEFYDRDFVNERRKKSYSILLKGLRENEKFDRILEWVKEGRSNGFLKIIVIFNTVEDAIRFFKKVEEENITSNKLLLHSRFNEKDRVKKHKELEFLKKCSEYLIVSTQTIEAGIDISSNLFITEVTPASSLIQRLGRFLRYEYEDKGRVYIWYEISENLSLKCMGNKYKVYDLELTNRTINKLKGYCDERLSMPSELTWFLSSSKINFHVPEDYQTILDSVYQDKDFQISEKEIEDFLSIFINVEQLSKVAFEKYLELEGSFVRDEILIPVIPKSALEKSELEGKRLIEYFMENIVPISVDQLKFLKITDALAIRRLGEDEGEALDIIQIPRFMTISEVLKKSPQRLIKFILENQILGLLIDAVYDSEKGLILK